MNRIVLITISFLFIHHLAFGGQWMFPSLGGYTPAFATSTSFESGYSGWVSGDLANLAVDTGGYNTGTHALHSISSAPSGMTLTGQVNTAGGSLTFYLLTAAASATYGNVSVQIDGSTVASNLTSGSSWQQKTVTIASGIHTVIFTFDHPTTGYAMYLDDIVIP